MYYKRSRRGGINNRKGKTSDYLMPFLIIICAGIIAVLLFNLFKIFFAAENPRAAYMHIVEGSAEMKAWGTDDFFSLTSDVLVMQGDEIRSSAGARLIVEFFDGTIMRMGANTVVEFESIVDEGRRPSIDLNLKRGNIWLNKMYRDTRNTDIAISSDNVVFRSNMAGIYTVENSDVEAVRVLAVFDNEGLLVDILREDGKRVVETERLGVGQEVVFDSRVLERYWQYKSPTVISAVSDDFKQTAWYAWNLEEDKDPTQFEKRVEEGDTFGLIRVEPEVLESPVEFDEDFKEDSEEEYVEESEEESVEEIAEDFVEEDSSPPEFVEVPQITSVAGETETDENGFYRVSSKVATLEGRVSGAHRVVVNDYTLQQFSPGDSSWRYFANADFDLMREGENIYEVYAENADGVRSEPLVVKVFYEPHAPAPVEEPSEEEVEEGDGEE